MFFQPEYQGVRGIIAAARAKRIRMVKTTSSFRREISAGIDKVLEAVTGVSGLAEQNLRVFLQKEDPASAALFDCFCSGQFSDARICAHSQGNIITSNALNAFVALRGKSAVANMKVYAFGSPVTFWSDANEIVQKHEFSNDAVTWMRNRRANNAWYRSARAARATIAISLSTARPDPGQIAESGREFESRLIPECQESSTYRTSESPVFWHRAAAGDVQDLSRPCDSPVQGVWNRHQTADRGSHRAASASRPSEPQRLCPDESLSSDDAKPRIRAHPRAADNLRQHESSLGLLPASAVPSIGSRHQPAPRGKEGSGLCDPRCSGCEPGPPF